MIAVPLPSPLGAVRIPKFLSPSRFGDLRKCRLSVLAPADAASLPTAPEALLGTVLHHVVTEVGEGRWGDADTPTRAFDTILAAVLSTLEPMAVPLEASVGRQRWFTRVARARSWALQDAPSVGSGESRMLRSPSPATDGPSEARVDVGYEAWIVWPSGRLRGRADRVEVRGDGLRVIENKSGAIYDRTGDLVEGIGLQVGLYALAIEAVAQVRVETVIRQDEAVNVTWDASTRASVRELLEQTLAELPEAALVEAVGLASPGPQCRRCRLRPACIRYLTEAPKLWNDEQTSGRMPLDVWGEIRNIRELSEGVRVELRDDAGRFVVVAGISPEWRVQDLPLGDHVYFFDLETDQARQHTERVQPSNLREAPPSTSSSRRRAFGLRVFRPR